MRNIWRYLQTEQNKNVAIVCHNRNVAEEILKDIKDKVKRHNLTNDNRLTGTTHTSIRYNTNRVMCVTDGFGFVDLKGFTINVLLLSEYLNEHQRMDSIWKLVQQMPPRGERIIATYTHNKGEHNE